MQAASKSFAFFMQDMKSKSIERTAIAISFFSCFLLPASPVSCPIHSG